MRRLFVYLAVIAPLFVLASSAVADDGQGQVMDRGDTAWVLTSAALVLLMTPALAFFYGGLVRKKNVLSILMQCMMLMCLMTVLWVVVGYSLAFGPDHGGIIGGLDWVCLKSVGSAPSAYADTIPHQAFMIFQAMFAIITPGLIIGAFAERMRFSAFCLFSLLWAVLVYCPVTHWFWGAGGFLKQAGALDFAGGAVVHINAGMAALAAALILRKRRVYPSKLSPPHNLPFAVLGAGLLWFGWFGFNAGSALKADSVAVSAFVMTHVAGAVAGLVWSLMDWIFLKRPTVLGMITGAVAGLASVTPASGYVDCTGALAIGVGAGVICWISVSIVKAKLTYDDSLDAFGVHGVGGIWGTLATGIWATKAVNAAGADGGLAQFAVQAKAVGITMAYSLLASVVIFKLVDLVIKVRVCDHEERVGLDLSQHREAAYTLIE